MANISIREFDAKNLFFTFSKKKYTGKKIIKLSDFDNLDNHKKYVIKADELFGKRKKLGFIGINLSLLEAKKWYKEKKGKNVIISGVSGEINNFILEEYIPHKEEYYFSIEAKRDFDEIRFSFDGGIDIEENWNKVKTYKLGLFEDIQKLDLKKIFGIKDKKIQNIIKELILFYKSEDFTFIEVNPFCFDEKGNLVIIDMVAKIDDCAFFLHKKSWENLEFPNPFGSKESSEEKYIKDLDTKTGSSLKLKILNPNGKIWCILSGGGGSLVITDTLGDLGYSKEIANYGELSGDPNKYFTKEYSEVIIKKMLENNKKNKYLIIAGAIANFTQIDKMFIGIIEVLEKYAKKIREQNIQILVRRGGINDKIGLKMFYDACKKLNINAEIADGDVYMTNILKKIKL